MANLTPVVSFDDVYQLETTDLALGGAGQIMNEQAQKLANRDAFLYETIIPGALNILSANHTFTTAEINTTWLYTGAPGGGLYDAILPALGATNQRDFYRIINGSSVMLDIDGSGINIDTNDDSGIVNKLRLYPGEEVIIANYGLANWSVLVLRRATPAGVISSQIAPAAGAYAFPGMYACNGSVLSETDYRYQRLFHVVGHEYDTTLVGSGTFRVPTLAFYIDGGGTGAHIFWTISL